MGLHCDMFNTKWHQSLCTYTKISHKKSRETYTGSLYWSLLGQGLCLSLRQLWKVMQLGPVLAYDRVAQKDQRWQHVFRKHAIHKHAAPWILPLHGLCHMAILELLGAKPWKTTNEGKLSAFSPEKRPLSLSKWKEATFLLHMNREIGLPARGLPRKEVRYLHARCHHRRWKHQIRGWRPMAKTHRSSPNKPQKSPCPSFSPFEASWLAGWLVWL